MCLNVIRAARADGVIDDIFTTSDGRFAPELTFGRYVRGVNGCIGGTYEPRVLTGYACHAPVAGEAIAPYADSLDWQWTQVLRTRDDLVVVADGEAGFYVPWRGRIYDLGGEANRVALFPITDHAPLPCEAFEYSVWLSNNPDSSEAAPEGAPDPSKWNPARLIRAFTQGWTRNPTAPGAADATRTDLDTWLRDNSTGEAVADALTTVWALPCGLTFRYVAIQAGNYGNPGPECVYHSSDDELDAVAGLNEDDTIICIDADGDGHRDAACGGGDCDDADPAVHPGAFERCDEVRDLDCLPARACPAGTVCDTMTGLCATQCFEGGCAEGFTCLSELCVDVDCAALVEPCPSGTLCRAGACVAPCDGAVCPRGQICAGGACIDPCAGVVCPTNQVCIAGDPGAMTVCGPGCTCTDLSVPLCPTDTECDRREGSPTLGRCVDPGCEALTCAPTEVCTAGACVDACDGVSCPSGRTCIDGSCVPDLCAGIACAGTQVCRDGMCYDACDGVSCAAGLICRDGACVPDPCTGVVCDDAHRCAGGVCVPIGSVDGGVLADGAATGPDGGGTYGGKDPGCACSVPGGATASPWWALVAVAVLIARRQHRPRRRPARA